MAEYNLGTARGRVEVDSGSIQDASRDLKNADIVLRQTGASLIDFGTQALAAFGYVVNIGREFEKNMDFVQSVTSATQAEIDALTQTTIELGKRGPFGPIELSEAFIELAKAGVGVDDIVNGIGEAVVDLAGAADITAQAAGEIVVQTAAIFGLAAEEVPRATDLIAGAANASMIDVQDFATTLKYAGPVAAALGIDLEDLATTISLLGQSGIRGSTAGTSLRQVMLNLSGATPKATEAMRELGIITEDGSNIFYDAEGNVKSLTEVFGILGDKLAGLNERQKSDYLRDIFGVRQLPTVLFLMEQGVDKFQEFNEQINSVTASDVAADRLDNLDGAIRRFQSTLEAVLLGPSGAFQDFLKNLVNIATEVLIFFDNLPDGLQQFILGALGVIGVLSILSGAFLLTIGNMVRAFRVVGELARVFQILGPSVLSAVKAFGTLGIALLTNPIFLVIAAIGLLIGILVYLYFHFEGVREVVDGAWQALQKFWDNVTEKFTEVWGAIKNFFRGFSNGWNAFIESFKDNGITTGLDNIIGWIERIGNALGDAWRSVRDFFKDLPNTLSDAFNDLKEGVTEKLIEIRDEVVKRFRDIRDDVLDALGGFFSAVGGFFTRLPGIIGGALSSAGNAIVAFFAALPARIGYILGFILGSLVRWSNELLILIVQTGLNFVTSFISILSTLPGLIVNLLTTIVTTLVSWGTQLLTMAIQFGTGFVTNLITFLATLPARVFEIFTSVLANVANFLPGFLSTAFNLGQNLFNGLVDVITALPGRVWDIFSTVLSNVAGFIGSAWGVAWDIGTAFKDGVIDVITGLPGLVKDIFLNVINGIKGLVGDAIGAAKSFGSGLWNGFKGALGINSPSYIEEALFAIEDQAALTAANLRNSVKNMGLSARRLPTLQNPQSVGLATPADVAGRGLTAVVVEGPLLNVDNLNGSEEEALSISRRLADLTYTQLQAQGRRKARVASA